jgi:hypothetical protein
MCENRHKLKAQNLEMIPVNYCAENLGVIIKAKV